MDKRLQSLFRIENKEGLENLNLLMDETIEMVMNDTEVDTDKKRVDMSRGYLRVKFVLQSLMDILDKEEDAKQEKGARQHVC